MRRACLVSLLVAVAVAAAGCDLFASEEPDPAARGVPPAETRSPVEGQPPIVWVGGVLQEIADGRLTIRDASSNPVRLRRLSGGTTRFLTSADGGWRELDEEELSLVEVGREACAEALLDGSNLVALRVFLDVACGPSAGAP